VAAHDNLLAPMVCRRPRPTKRRQGRGRRLRFLHVEHRLVRHLLLCRGGKAQGRGLLAKGGLRLPFPLAAAKFDFARAELLLLPQRRRKPPQRRHALLASGRGLPGSGPEVAHGREPPVAGTKGRPDAPETGDPFLRGPAGHLQHVRLQHIGIRQFESEASGQLLDTGQDIRNADGRRHAVEQGFHPPGQRADLLRRAIADLEPQVDPVKPGERDDRGGQRERRRCGKPGQVRAGRFRAAWKGHEGGGHSGRSGWRGGERW